MSVQNEFRFSELTPLQLVCGTIVISVAIIGITTFLCIAISSEFNYKIKRTEIWNQEDKSDER